MCSTGICDCRLCTRCHRVYIRLGIKKRGSDRQRSSESRDCEFPWARRRRSEINRIQYVFASHICSIFSHACARGSTAIFVYSLFKIPKWAPVWPYAVVSWTACSIALLFIYQFSGPQHLVGLNCDVHYRLWSQSCIIC